LVALKTVFVELFQPFIAAFVASLRAVNSTAVALSNSASEPTRWNFAKALEGWDATFDKLLKGLENKAAEVRFCLNGSSRVLTEPRSAFQDRKSRLRPTARPHPTTPSPGSSDVDTRGRYSLFSSASAHGGY
jgi:signal recognition particle receptor subunit alpha